MKNFKWKAHIFPDNIAWSFPFLKTEVKLGSVAANQLPLWLVDAPQPHILHLLIICARLSRVFPRPHFPQCRFFRNPQAPGFFFIEKLYRRGSNWSAVHTCHGKKGLKWDAGFFLLLFYLFFIFLSESHTHPSGKMLFFSRVKDTKDKYFAVSHFVLFGGRNMKRNSAWKGIKPIFQVKLEEEFVAQHFWQFSTSNRFPFLKWKFREEKMGSEIKFGVVFKMFYY